MEIRVYCECIEQGEIFFLPLFTNAFPEYEVKLARIPRANQVKKNRGLKGVFDLANPDGLATFVDSKGEFPFATFEISDAVKTEDHELQRYPQICSSVAYDLVHIKISPHNKGTSASFGGNVNFNPLTIPRILHEEYEFKGAFILNWPNGANQYLCRRNPEFPSCPESGSVKFLQSLVEAMATAIEHGVRPTEGTKIFSDYVWSSLSKETRMNYSEELLAAPSKSDLVSEWNAMKVPKSKGYLRKRIITDDHILVTIPRFDRDSPGPGEVMSYAMMSGAKTVGIAYCGRDRSMRIDSNPDDRTTNKPCNSITEVMNRFFEIFQCKKDKMPVELLNLLKDSWSQSRSSSVDITEALLNLVKLGNLKKWVTTFVFFADYLKIHDRPEKKHSVVFHWDRVKLVGEEFRKSTNAMEHLRIFNDVQDYPPLTLIDPQHMPVLIGGEDYVTWAATTVLKELGWKFLALSYPGSQGDGAILPSGSGGLSRERTYCDGLGVKGDTGLLLEAKHKEGQIKADVRKLNSLIANESSALSKAYHRLGSNISKWKTCIAFGTDNPGLSDISTGHGLQVAQRRINFMGVDYVFVLMDALQNYQLLCAGSSHIYKEGKLPMHQMHGVATNGKIPPSTVPDVSSFRHS